MWIFGSPKNYVEMIEKISKSTFIISAFLLYVLSCANEQFSCFLCDLSFGMKYQLIGTEFYLAGVYLPLLIGIIEHVFKIHDKVSTWLNIRERYDKKVIINGMAEDCNVNLNATKINKKQYSELMSKTFYRYASSTKPEIDPHSILLTLNEWCWFWITIDTTLLFLSTGICFLILKCSLHNLIMVTTILIILVIVLYLIKKQAETYTKQEIKAILSNSERKKEITEVLKKCITE